MADSNDWRSSVTASERYDNIQKIQKTSPDKNAFTIETTAYQNSTTKEEYLSAITIASSSSPPPPSQASPPFSPPSPSSPGIKIGTHLSCHYLTSGLTSSVYFTKTTTQTLALKVISHPPPLPHSPHREARILSSLTHPNIIPLLETFTDPFVLVFPYLPYTLSSLLPLTQSLLLPILTQLFSALNYIHSLSIIHRDIKPSSILISPDHHLYLSDFGISYHPTFSPTSEPPTQKYLDVGTGPYRAPETLFGNTSYSTEIDIWAAGCTLYETLTGGKELFTCPPTNEDGSQLGLILSIFKTLGTPTEEIWPEAKKFKTKPFEMYRVFEGKENWWEEGMEDQKWGELVKGCVRYESGKRLKAGEVLKILEGWKKEEEKGR
ncbi:kinase-like domain-containing protein [Podospora fimiseda]|uniref:cyclin-dependent kinase n=1 Tax=Podospora fimiseda TaxID=252190 RepID=A0AAN7H1D1_9PEZI|nr:kinase-like domain-containing protein [Podospora fimiseda]